MMPVKIFMKYPLLFAIVAFSATYIAACRKKPANTPGTGGTLGQVSSRIMTVRDSVVTTSPYAATKIYLQSRYFFYNSDTTVSRAIRVSTPGYRQPADTIISDFAFYPGMIVRNTPARHETDTQTYDGDGNLLATTLGFRYTYIPGTRMMTTSRYGTEVKYYWKDGNIEYSVQGDRDTNVYEYYPDQVTLAGNADRADQLDQRGIVTPGSRNTLKAIKRVNSVYHTEIAFSYAYDIYGRIEKSFYISVGAFDTTRRYSTFNY
jgi:hypothetical protein